MITKKMSGLKDYKKQATDPRWQKKRLEILYRDNFTCVLCMDNKNTLHVHHKKYITGKNYWEYDNSYLITLCDKCHYKTHNKKDDIKKCEIPSSPEVSILINKLENKFTGSEYSLIYSLHYFNIEYPDIINMIANLLNTYNFNKIYNLIKKINDKENSEIVNYLKNNK